MTTTANPAPAILIADDSRMTRASLKVMLGDTRTLHEAETGAAALESYLTFKPDIILLDLLMPEENGLAVIRSIRKDHNDTDTYIIVLTGEEDPDLHTLSLNMGANDFLAKPFSKAELLARIGVAERQTAITKQLREYSTRIRKEIELVAHLQQKLLPDASPLIPGIRIESIYNPSGHASGDYYDYFTLPDGVTLRAIIADVSGHGARAAFIMGIVRTLFRLTQMRTTTLVDTVQLINKHLLETIGTEADFVTLFCVDFDTRNGSLEYINAGHCPAILRHPDGTIETLHANVPLLGFFDVATESLHCSFKSGSRILLYTDGFFDWRMTDGALFSLSRFLEIASAHMSVPADYVDSLQNSLTQEAGGKQNFRDDVTALWIAMG
ncbi:SpoIIE family protein phosphatase [Desulfovibrio subterraneus]|uniref:SpoIIE family protein phosphatase n=1 Tax=Desulfovibrio subterraneus TaxID=2718620 RepID=UPI0022B8E3A6|nr:SpoIIE family protein phosphatase [Desulfovibrio subterraneus]WBF67918.1 SpoIIE family protein phosphatase [Desulfovibrio subterraneus]